MKKIRCHSQVARSASRLFTAFMLLVLAFGANADDCFSLYAKSGATPGSPTCKLDVTSNTPGGMGNYACINDLALIDQWCNATDAPSDDTCPWQTQYFRAAVSLQRPRMISSAAMMFQLHSPARIAPLFL